MARKFSGAARARGFQPIDVSDANIARMRENNQRILDGMRARRESIRRNDERQLQAMQENAAYSAKTRQRDYNIGAQNLRTERQQAEYDAQARTREIQNQQAGIDAVTSAVSKFSSTLLDLEKKKIAAKEKQDQDRVFVERVFGPQTITPEEVSFKDSLGVETEARVSLEGTLQIAEAEGAPANEVSKARFISTEDSAARRRTSFQLDADLEFDSVIAKTLAENPELNTDPDKALAALQLAAANYAREKGFSTSQIELLAPGARVIYQKIQTTITGIRAKNTEENNTRSINNATDMALADWKNQAVPSFLIVQGIEGNEAAHAWVKTQAMAMDENGDFLLTDAQWSSIDVYGDGRAYFVFGEEKGAFERRGVDILNARAEARRTWQRNQNTTERHAYEEESKAWHNHVVVQGNNTPEDLAAAVASFKDDVKGIPEWLRKLRSAGGAGQGEYNTNLITQARDFEARGMLNPDLIQKVYERDPKIANELQASYEKQDPFAKDDMYKKYYNNIEKLPVKQVMGVDNPQLDSNSIRDAGKLQEAFKQLVERGVADGASIKDAAYTASKTIEEGFKVQGGTFQRVYNPTTGFYEFPNLYEKTAREIAIAEDEANTAFLKNLDKGTPKNIFSNPNMIFTDAQFDQELVKMARPGYNFHPKLSILAKRIKGSEMEILQKIADLKGRPPILPPPSLRQVMDYPPAAKALLNRFQSANRNARGHGQGMSFTGTGWNEGAVPANLREFYRASAERHGISPAENSAMGEIESNHGQYRVSYNGTSYGVMQINRSAHPAFFAEYDGKNDDAANIDYGTAYYANLKKQYNNDPIVAAMAYNGGPGTYNMWLAGQTPDWVKTEVDRAEWDRIVNEMLNHGRKFATALYKYSGDKSVLQHPSIQRN